MPGQNGPLHTTADAVGSALELGFPAPLEPGRPRFPVVVAACVIERVAAGEADHGEVVAWIRMRTQKTEG